MTALLCHHNREDGKLCGDPVVGRVQVGTLWGAYLIVVGAIVISGYFAESTLQNQTSPPSTSDIESVLIPFAILAAIFVVGPLGYILISEQIDRYRCWKHGHVPVKAKRMVWKDCDLGFKHFDKWEEVENEWNCKRCGKKIDPQEGPRMEKLVEP